MVVLRKEPRVWERRTANPISFCFSLMVLLPTQTVPHFLDSGNSKMVAVTYGRPLYAERSGLLSPFSRIRRCRGLLCSPRKRSRLDAHTPQLPAFTRPATIVIISHPRREAEYQTNQHTGKVCLYLPHFSHNPIGNHPRNTKRHKYRATHTDYA